MRNLKDNKLTKEVYLKRLEVMYDNSSWDDIIFLINEIEKIGTDDPVVLNILEYVETNNKISFKQWKVLRLFYRDNNPDKKFKYGK